MDSILVYVPEADQMSAEDAKALAVERDQFAAEQLTQDCAEEKSALRLEAAAQVGKSRVEKILSELGY